MIIKNREELITSSLRARAVELIEAGIKRVLPAELMHSAVKYNNRTRRLSIMDKKKYVIGRSRVFVVGGGKASGRMAEELESILGASNITAGIVNCNSEGYSTRSIVIRRAGHPLPDESGVKGVREMLAMKARYNIGRGDLVICLISGGGSSLMPCPATGITLEDQQKITQLLLGCGAEIREINAVRKHISLIKGGNLGQFYSPATVASLIISDVVGDDLDVIASGPTVPDSTTFNDALYVLRKYDLLEKAPYNVVEYITSGCRGRQAETPKMLNNCDNFIIGNNRVALEAMAEKAQDLGLKPHIATSELKGDTSLVAYRIANEIKSGRYRGFSVVLFGGETTPKLPEQCGRGGRNQHYAAVSMLAMKDLQSPWLVASVGTDGSDYLPDIAGAMVDERSLELARVSGINVETYIENFDSNSLFSKMGRSLIITGPTGTNVSDIILYLLA